MDTKNWLYWLNLNSIKYTYYKYKETRKKTIEYKISKAIREKKGLRNASSI